MRKYRIDHKYIKNDEHAVTRDSQSVINSSTLTRQPSFVQSSDCSVKILERKTIIYDVVHQYTSLWMIRSPALMSCLFGLHAKR